MSNTQRENRLEELGRVDAERAYTSKGKRNLRDEKDRIRSELREGGRTGRTRKPGVMDKGPKGTKKGIDIFVKLKGGEGPANRHDKIRKVNVSKGYKSGGAVLKGKKVGCQIK